jgi:hypothetical protein
MRLAPLFNDLGLFLAKPHLLPLDRLIPGLWPILDQWMTDGKDSKNNTILKFILNALKQMPVTLEILSGGGNIPKTVKKLAKKWPHEEVSRLASELFETYLSVLENNTAATPVTVAPKENPRSVLSPPPKMQETKVVKEVGGEEVEEVEDVGGDGSQVEDWENEWSIYVAEDDETPQMIARKHKVSLKDLLQVNVWKKGFEEMIGSSKLMEGTSIQVPTNGPNDPRNLKAPQKRSASDSASSVSNPKRIRSESVSSSARRPSASSAAPSNTTNSPKAGLAAALATSSAKAQPVKNTILVKQPPKVQPPPRNNPISSGRPGGFGVALGT